MLTSLPWQQSKKADHHILQALQKDASGNVSASASKASTRKRRLQDPATATTAAAGPATATTAAAATAAVADAAEQASPPQKELSCGVSDTATTSTKQMAIRPVNNGLSISSGPSKLKRRTSRRNTGPAENGAASAMAPTAGQTAPRAEQNGQHTANAVDGAQVQPQTHAAQTMQSQAAPPQTALAPSGRARTRAGSVTRTRAGSVTRTDSQQLKAEALIKIEDSAAAQQDHSDAEHTIAGISTADHAESDRDRRLLARKQRAAVKPRSRLARGWHLPPCPQKCVRHQLFIDPAVSLLCQPSSSSVSLLCLHLLHHISASAS